MKDLSQLSPKYPVLPHERDASCNESIDSLGTKIYAGNGRPCYDGQQNVTASKISGHALPVAFNTNYTFPAGCSFTAPITTVTTPNSGFAPDQSIIEYSTGLQDSSCSVGQHNVTASKISEHALPVAFNTNYTSPAGCSFTAPITTVNTPISGFSPDQSIVESSAGLQDSVFILGKKDRFNPQLLSGPTMKKPKQETPDLNCLQNSESQIDGPSEKEKQQYITLLYKQQETQIMKHSRMISQSYLQSVTNETDIVQTQMPYPLYQGVQCGILPNPEGKKDMKKPKQETLGSNYFQGSVSQSGRAFGGEMQQNNTVLQKLQGTQSTQHSKMIVESYFQCKTVRATTEEVLKLQVQMPSSLYQGVQCGGRTLPEIKIVPNSEAKKDKEGHVLNAGSCNSNLQQPLSFIRSTHQMQQNSTGTFMMENSKKNTSRKRKLTMDHLLSPGALVHSLASDVGDSEKTSPGSYSTGADVDATVSHMDKAALLSAGLIRSVYTNSCITNPPYGRVNEQPLLVCKKTETLNKAISEAMSCFGFPSTSNDANASLWSKLSFVGTQSLQPPPGNGDPAILDRLSRICMVTQRYGQDKRKSTNEKYITSKSSFHLRPPHRVHSLNLEDSEECTALTDEICMSKYLIGGNRNICKNRVMAYMRVRCIPRGDGHPVNINTWIKLILFESQKPGDHKIGAKLVYEEGSIPIAILPSAFHADQLATQFTSLMEREGYKLEHDQIQPSHTGFSASSISNFSHVGSFGVTGLSSATPICVRSLKTDPCIDNCIPFLDQFQLLPRRTPAIRTKPSSCLNLTKRQKMDISSHLNSMQQEEHLQNMGSLLSVEDENLLRHLNMQMRCELPNNSKNVQPLQFLQYQQQRSQQQAILPSKIGRLGASNNVGVQDSGLNMSETRNNLWQVPGFYHNVNGNIYKGNLQFQATRVKSREEKFQAVGAVDDMLIKTLSDRNVGACGDGTLLDRTPRRSHVGKLQMDLPKIPYVNLHTVNYGHLKESKVQQEVIAHRPLQWQQQEQVDLPQQLSSPFLTHKIQSPSMTSRNLSPTNARLASKCNPQLTSEMAGSGGCVAHVTSSAMELQNIDE